MEFKTEMGTFIRVPRDKKMNKNEHYEMCRELVSLAIDNEKRINAKSSVENSLMVV